MLPLRARRGLVRATRLIGLLGLIALSILLIGIAGAELLPPRAGGDTDLALGCALGLGLCAAFTWLLLRVTGRDLRRTDPAEVARRGAERRRRQADHSLAELRDRATRLRGTCPLRSDPRAPEGPYERAVDGSPLSEREAEMAVLVGESIDTGLRQWSGTWELPEGRQVQEIREAARELAALARADEPESPHAADVLRLCAWIDGQQGTELGRGELF